MPSYAEELAAEADSAIAAMKTAALAARAVHARSELLRHMLTTAAKMRDRPPEAAIAGVTGEWMAAWGVEGGQDAAVADAMRALTVACLEAAQAPGAAADARLREAMQRLDAAFTARGTSLADEMAWRSQCAHGWWECVAPRPADIGGAKARPATPRRAEDRAFWEAGCADFCR